MTGDAANCRSPPSPNSGNTRASATTTAERFDSPPPLVKFETVQPGRPNLPASQVSVCRSISFAAGEVRQAANCGLYIATSKSATTDATVTLGLNRPK